MSGIPDWIERLGWVLVHFVWQGTVIGLAARLALILAKRASAQSRYVLLCAAFLACGLSPCLTWFAINGDAPAYSEAAISPNSAPVAASTPIPLPANAAPVAVSVSPSAGEFPLSTWNFGRIYDGIHDALPWLVMLWGLGILALSLGLAYGWTRLRRFCALGAPLKDREWIRRFEALAHRMGVHRTLLLLESALVEVPTVIGWMCPVILVPAVFFIGLPPDQIEAVLAHELAHIRRHDYLVNLVQIVIETLLFYHPVVWWLSHAIREERENCCDDLVLQIVADKATYATALATLEESRSLPMAITLAATGGSLLKRIKRITGITEGRVSMIPFLLTIMTIVALTSLTGWTFVRHYSPHNALPHAESGESYIIGAVVDDKGRGVGGAQVTDYTGKDNAITDPRGHFVMPYRKMGNNQGRLLFAITQVGLGFADFKEAPANPSRDGAPTQTIKLLHRDRILQGKLVDSKGQAVQNASICPESFQLGDVRMGQPIGGGKGNMARFWNSVAGRSGADGKFTLRFPTGVEVALRIYADGYGTIQFLEVDLATSDLGTLTIPDGGDIAGKLVQATTGKPLKNYIVRATRKSSPSDLGTVGNHFEDGFLEATDEEGNFRFKRVRVGSYEVSVERSNGGAGPGLVPGPIAVVQVGSHATATADLSMVQGQRVTGRILLGKTNTPVTGETAIELIPGQYYGQYFYTRKDGTFTTYLLPGTYHFRVNDYSDEFGPVQVIVDPHQETEPVILRAADDVMAMKVKVRTSGGKPLPDPMFAWAWSWYNGQAREALCGRDEATFEGIKKNSQPVLIVDVPGYRVWHSSPLNPADYTAPLEAILQPASPVILSGRIVDDVKGKPIPNLLVSHTEFLDGGIHWTSGSFVSVDSNGRFTLSGLRSGDRIRLNILFSSGTPQQVVISNDPSGMFEQFENSRDGVLLAGSGSIQLSDTQIGLRPLSYTIQGNFSQYYFFGPFGWPKDDLLMSQRTDPLAPPAFWGIGVTLGAQGSNVEIKKVVPDSPAAKVGIQAGDIFLEADGKPVKSLNDAADWARGPIETKVHIRIKRGEAIRDFELMRKDMSDLDRTVPKAGPNAGVQISNPTGPETSLQARYLKAYLEIAGANQDLAANNPRKARDNFTQALAELKLIQATNPEWEKALVTHRIAETEADLAKLGEKSDPVTDPQHTDASPTRNPTENGVLAAGSENKAAKDTQIGSVRIQYMAIDMAESDYQAHRQEIAAAVLKGEYHAVQHLVAAREIGSSVCPTTFGHEVVFISGPTNPSLWIACTPTLIDKKIAVSGSLTINSQQWDRSVTPAKLMLQAIPNAIFPLSGSLVPMQVEAMPLGGVLEPFAALNQNNKEPRRLFLFVSVWPEEASTGNDRMSPDAFELLVPARAGDTARISTGETLTVRTFLAPASFFSDSGAPTNAAPNVPLMVSRDVQPELESRGIKFPAGATATFLCSSNKLVVRDTPEQLDLINKLIENLSMQTTGNVTPVQTVTYIENELAKLRVRLNLTPEQERATKATMVLVASGQPIQKTVDQTFQEILRPDQLVVWEQMKKESVLGTAIEMTTMETDQMARRYQLSDAQKEQLWGALYTIELKDQGTVHAFRTNAEKQDYRGAYGASKQVALMNVLQPGQMAAAQREEVSKIDVTNASLELAKPNLPSSVPQ
jgi:beta-lactamase regulating signal transducer with metallopeptidase domain